MSNNQYKKAQAYIKKIRTVKAVKAQKIKQMWDITGIILKVSGLTVDDLKSKCRKPELVEARYVLFYMIRKHIKKWPGNKGKFPMVIMGSYFNRDHTTIIHALNTIKNMIITKNDPYINLINKFTVEYTNFKNKKK